MGENILSDDMHMYGKVFSVLGKCTDDYLFVLDIKNGKDDYESQRKAIIAKTHNVTDNYCKRVLDYFKITI